MTRLELEHQTQNQSVLVLVTAIAFRIIDSLSFDAGCQSFLKTCAKAFSFILEGLLDLWTGTVVSLIGTEDRVWHSWSLSIENEMSKTRTRDHLNLRQTP
jgi:hypothetical protein